MMILQIIELIGILIAIVIKVTLFVYVIKLIRSIIDYLNRK